SFQAATNYDVQSLTIDPLFIEAAAPKRAFRLKEGPPGIDGGSFLTPAVGAGSGTTLTVANAGFFTDGFGLVRGDMIQVGANSPVEIISIDYATNVITLASAQSWSNGQAVSLAYNGSAPDIGAFESTTGSATSGLQVHWTLDEGTGTTAAD